MVSRTSAQPLVQPNLQPGKAGAKTQAKGAEDAAPKLKTTKRNNFRLSSPFSSGKKEHAAKMSKAYSKATEPKKPLTDRTVVKRGFKGESKE
ncbi:MAG TPA: hypothetical protein VND97_00465, partial [Beijerinckiaceae bacterium]|nr:hypothetical protein [Beijerinckiaceae bacterium]